MLFSLLSLQGHGETWLQKSAGVFHCSKGKGETGERCWVPQQCVHVELRDITPNTERRVCGPS